MMSLLTDERKLEEKKLEELRRTLTGHLDGAVSHITKVTTLCFSAGKRVHYDKSILITSKQ